MDRIFRWAAIGLAALSLAAGGGAVLAQPKNKGQEMKQQKQEQKKQHHHHDGKSLLGDKIKQDGKHKFHENGKFSAFAEVKGGKIARVSVTHSERGNVPVKKYKTNKKMAESSSGGMQPVSLILAQAQYLGQTYIGYSYIDDYGNEVIYWYPYDMILDGDTGAIEYIPAY